MFEVIGLSLELALTGFIFVSVKNINERIGKIEKTLEKGLYRTEVQNGISKSEKPIRGIN